MREGAIHGIVIQDPFKMGYLGVKMMIEKLNGKSVQKRIDTGVTFIELEDLERIEIKELISPNLDKWLNQ
jgi:ribose transport system substrate-binding protein